MRHEHPHLIGLTPLLMAALLFGTACAPSVVQIRAPYHQKLRPGDGVKIMVKDGTIFSGRVTYVDQAVIVVRTPKQTIQRHPVQSARFGTSIPWETVHRVRVAGTLDKDGALVSNEEIRVNRKSQLNQKMMLNIGLLGAAASFLIGAAVQDNIAPADPNNLVGNHGKARLSFWSILLAGSAASLYGGYKAGDQMDQSRAVDRIERFRARLREEADSLTANSVISPLPSPATKLR